MGVPDLSGLGFILVLGFISLLVLIVSVPPGAVFIIAWLLEPRTGYAAASAWAYAQVGWLILIGALVVIAKISDHIQHKRIMRNIAARKTEAK